MKKNYYILLTLLFIAFFSTNAFGATVATVQTNPSTAIVIGLVNQDPDPAFSGAVVDVRLSLENQGDVPAQNYVVEISPSYPFHLISPGDSIQNVGTIGPYQQGSDTKIIKFQVLIDNNALAGQYPLNVIGYVNGQKSQFSIQKSFNISVKSKQNAEITNIDKSSLLPGEMTQINFTISNVGNSPLRDLSFYWQNPDGVILPVGSDNTRYIKFLDIGESQDISFNVIADTNANPGLFKLNLFLTYSDSVTGQTTTTSTVAGMYVGGSTDFDVSYSDSASGSTSFSVANVGSNPASSVTVSVPNQPSWSVTGSNSVIIGNLNKGDYTVASFTLISSGGVSGAGNFTRPNRNFSNPSGVPNQNPSADQGNFSFRQRGNFTQGQTGNEVRLDISYTDTMGQRRTVEKLVSVGSSARSRGNFSSGVGQTGGAGRGVTQQNVFVEYKWYFIGAAAIIILFFVWRRMKSKKRISDLKNKESLLLRKK